MKVFVYILLLWSVRTYSLLCQNISDFCGTPASVSYTINQSSTKTQSNNGFIWIKVRVHIVQRSDCSGGASASDIPLMMEILNNDFYLHRIQFCLTNIQNICNDTVYGLSLDNLLQDCNGNGVKDAFDCNNNGKFDYLEQYSSKEVMDIFVLPVDNLLYYFNNITGIAPGTGGTSFITGGKIFERKGIHSYVVSHEAGHCLSLYHTFRGTCSPPQTLFPCKELVNGSNCHTCGDKICDTPADPSMFNVDSVTCSWNGVTCPGTPSVDVNGMPYVPNKRNIMSYTHPNCADHFTPMQGERMRKVLFLSTIHSDMLVFETLELNHLLLSSGQYKFIEALDTIYAYHIEVAPQSTLIMKAGKYIKVSAFQGNNTLSSQAFAQSYFRAFIASAAPCSNAPMQTQNTRLPTTTFPKESGEASSLFISLNPSDGKLKVKANSTITKIEVLTLTGQIKSVFFPKRKVYEGGYLPEKGIFIIRIYLENNTILHKKIINI